MKVLFITNSSTERCGVREYGDHMIDALRRAGVQVFVWDGTYSKVVERGYLPPAYEPYDLIHFNWDPQAINHYLPLHFVAPFNRPPMPPLSLFLHDVPPNSTCPVADVARWTFSFEPMPGSLVVPEAVPVTPANLATPSSAPVVIGLSGIRNDPGAYLVQNLCALRGWTVNQPAWWDDAHGAWLSTADEIRRLSRSTVNVCWYGISGRGKSMAAMYCIASRRPLVISASSMFSAILGYADSLYRADSTDTWDRQLPALLDQAVAETLTGTERPPTAIAEALSWDRVIQPIIAAWEGR